jgi:uncharacterized Tic20 family protein
VGRKPVPPHATSMSAMPTRVTDVAPSEIRWAVAAHVSPLWVIASMSMFERRPVAWAAVVAFLGPLVLALLVRDRGDFVDAAMKNALAFALSIGTYSLVAVNAIAAGYVWAPAAALLEVGLLSLVILALNWLVFAALATRAALRGEIFDYPGCLAFWRRAAAWLTR